MLVRCPRRKVGPPIKFQADFVACIRASLAATCEHPKMASLDLIVLTTVSIWFPNFLAFFQDHRNRNIMNMRTLCSRRHPTLATSKEQRAIDSSRAVDENKPATPHHVHCEFGSHPYCSKVNQAVPDSPVTPTTAPAASSLPQRVAHNER